jgi:hypothetical protein
MLEMKQYCIFLECSSGRQGEAGLPDSRLRPLAGPVLFTPFVRQKRSQIGSGMFVAMVKTSEF